MPGPGILTGSSSPLNIFRNTSSASEAVSGTGVFGPNPGSTPKFALNSHNGGHARDAEYRETMARIFIEVPAEQVDAVLATVTPETQPLARVLMSGANTGGSGGTGFIDFLLTNANEALDEKAQIVDTLTDNYVAFYSGQMAPVFSYSGTVLNTYQDDQRVWLLRLYSEILRGTRLANRNLIARLRYDSFIVSGYLENLRLGLDGQTEHTAGTFQFSMRVKRLNVFTPSLGAPTVVQTPATNNSILSGTSGPTGGDARNGTLMSEDPTTALESPAAGPRPSMISDAQREYLRSQGFTDAQIDATIDEAAGLSVPPDIDPREASHVASQQGLNRIEESVANTGDQGPNPDNVSNDGTGGTTNIMGDTTQLPEFLQAAVDSTSLNTPIQRRTVGRRRGGV